MFKNLIYKEGININKVECKLKRFMIYKLNSGSININKVECKCRNCYWSSYGLDVLI